jgi:hypothetical protein
MIPRRFRLALAGLLGAPDGEVARRVTKVCVTVFPVALPSVTEPRIVVVTTPVNTTEGNDGGVLPPLLK